MKNRKTIRKFLLASALLSFAAVGTSCGEEQKDPIVEEIKVTSIDFKLESQSVYIGLETFIQNVKVLPENASNHKLSWSVKDPDIAEIVNDKIVGKKVGKTKIIAKAMDGSNVSKEVDFEVRELAAPSSWEVNDSYSFYFEKSFTPEIKFYPDFPYVNKACTYEVIEGQDVLKVENGVISAYKKGSGVIKVTSVGNPSLSTAISCVADDDLLCKYGHFTYIEGADLKLHGNKDERISVLDFGCDVRNDNWPVAYIELDKPRNAMSTKISLDAKLECGQPWYSLRLVHMEENTPIFIGPDLSTGTSKGGVAPTENAWTTSEFDYSEYVGEYEYLAICINASSEYVTPGIKRTQILFDNLRFAEFVDRVDSMDVEDTAFVGVDSEIEIKPVFTPSNCSDRRVYYTIKEGNDVISIVDNKIKGLKAGTAVVKVQSVLNPLFEKDVAITVSDDLLCKATLHEASAYSKLKVHANKDGRDIVLDFSAQMTHNSWPVAIIKLDDPKNAMSTKILLDAKLVSGESWYSVRLFHKQGNDMIQVGPDLSTGTEATATPPVKDAWTTSTFDFSNYEGEYEYIYICINADIDNAKSGDSTTEILFNDIRFGEFVDYVDSMDVEETAFVGVDGEIEIKPVFTPSNCSDRRVNYTIKEGADFVSIEGNKIKGIKAGTAVVGVQSVLNPSLEKDVSITISDDLLCRATLHEASKKSKLTVHPNKDGRNVVLDFCAEMTHDSWPVAIVKLDKARNAMSTKISLDAKLVSGESWYSVRLYHKDGDDMIQVGPDLSTGTEATATPPVKDAWTTSTFDFTNYVGEYEYIYICIHADSDYATSGDPATEVLFNNLRFAEFVDRVDSIEVQEESLVGVGNTLEIKAKVSPENCSDRRLSYSIKSGEDYIDIVDGKIYGKTVGTGVVTVSSVLNPQISKDVTIIVTDDLLVCLPVADTTAVDVKYLPNIDGRTAVTSISHKSTPTEAWYMLILDLGKSVEAKKLTLSFDAKYVSGKKWFSINLCATSNPWGSKAVEVGYGTEYNDNNWHSETYHSESSVSVRYLAISLNSVKIGNDEEVCFLFSNLVISESE